MLTHRARILAALRGEAVDRLPYVPRLDLWYLANSTSATLPRQHAGRAMNEIARAEGWALHHRFADDQLDPAFQPLYLHRGINVFYSKDTLFDVVLPADVEVKVERTGSRTRVEYHTPLGMVSTTMHYDIDSQRHGITIPALVEHLIKTPGDYGPAGYLFEHMDLVPSFERFERWAAEELREDGVPVALGSFNASPFQLIQRDLSDPTQFFVHYKDCNAEMRELAERIAPLYDKALRLLRDAPAEVVWWGSNYDEMLTYPPYFEKEIQPWIRKAAEVLGSAGKLVLCHTDGENRGLMDLIRDSGMHIAESFCPAPMTKVPLAEYYQRWSPNLALFGGIPSTMVLPETSDADFEAYIDELFRAVAPGRRLVVGIADEVPPQAIFSRLQRIGERVEREGRLPLQAGAYRLPTAAPGEAKPATAPAPPAQDAYEQVRRDVFKGEHIEIKAHVKELLGRGMPASEILERGLIAAITVVGDCMAAGEVFIPEVLLAARAMTAAVEILEPHLAVSGERPRGKILIGTVAGDMHDIGKNLVVTMLKGVGFDVRDLGVNVPRGKFCEAVDQIQPDILGLSALLTTTMMEMRGVIEGLEAKQLRHRCKVMVGGAPVSEQFAARIGADGYASNAVEAVRLVRRLISERAPVPSRSFRPT